VLLHQRKNAYETQRLVGEGMRRGCLQFAVLDLEAVDLLRARGLEGQKRPARAHLARAAKAIAKCAGKIVEQRRVPVVVAHEGLHAPQDGAVLVAETVRNLPLQPQ